MPKLGLWIDLLTPRSVAPLNRPIPKGPFQVRKTKDARFLNITTKHAIVFELTRFPQAHSTDVVLSSLCPQRRWSGAGVGIGMLSGCLQNAWKAMCSLQNWLSVLCPVGGLGFAKCGVGQIAPDGPVISSCLQMILYVPR